MERKRIYLSPPHMGGQEETLVHEAFATNWVAPLGPHVDGFEQELASYLGVPFVAALSSGTAAIHLALVMLGISRGDLVLVSSFTFAATANPVVYQGATPVFIGSERETLGMSPHFLDEALAALGARGTLPKAVIGVDLFGIPEQNSEIEKICQRYQVPFVEDAAEALGSSLGGRKMGTFGKMAALSFNGNKIITTSGGGALVLHEKKDWDRARFLATQARDPAPHYLHSTIGYNYRMSNLVAAVGRGQLKVLDRWVERRRANRAYYQEALGDLKGLAIFSEPTGRFWNSWLTLIEVDSKISGGIDAPRVMEALASQNIESRPVWKPLHTQPVFADCEYFGDNFETRFFERGLCLPSGSSLESEDLARISGCVRGLFGES